MNTPGTVGSNWRWRMRSGELNIKDFISDYFTFDQAVEAYQKLLDRKILKKGIITF